MKWTTFITWNWEKRWIWNFGSCQKTKETNVRNQWDKESRDILWQLKICWIYNIVATTLEDMSLLIWSDWFVSGVTPLQWQWTTVMHSALSPVSQHFRHQASLTAKKWPLEVSDAISLIIHCSLKILRAIFRNPVRSYAPTVSECSYISHYLTPVEWTWYGKVFFGDDKYHETMEFIAHFSCVCNWIIGKQRHPRQ